MPSFASSFVAKCEVIGSTVWLIGIFQELGLSVAPYIKTSLSPGSHVVQRYLEAAGLLQALEKLGFYLAGWD